MGLPTAFLLSKAGYIIQGYDIDKKKIDMLQHEQLPFEEKGLADIFQQSKNNFSSSTTLKKSDAFIITVPTPLTKTNTCDLSFVESAIETVMTVLNDNNLVILESTVPPGTTIGMIKPRLDTIGKSYYLSYVSEKAIPGNTIYEMQYNHRIIGGIDEQSAKLTKEIYSSFVKAPIHLTDTTTAETVKLMENTFRDVNIALANELAMTLKNLKINAWNAIKLANYHPRVNIHQPGPGVGGHCIPIDPWFISNENNILIKNARFINDSMPSMIFKEVKRIIGDQHYPKIAVFGVAYKGDIDDTRESPAIPLIKKAKSKKWKVSIFDPHVNHFMYPLDSLEQSTKDADCIVMMTNHKMFADLDPKKIGENMRKRIVLDARNIINRSVWEDAGFQYHLLFNSS